MSKKYCDWALKSELEKKYHDEEWGKPVFDDKKFFEMLVLEYMQADDFTETRGDAGSF